MKELIAMGPAFALIGPELNCRKKTFRIEFSNRECFYLTGNVVALTNLCINFCFCMSSV